MMALADDNNAMPPQPLVAPPVAVVTQRLAGGVTARNRGQKESCAAQMTPLSRVTNIASASATSFIMMSRAASSASDARMPPASTLFPSSPPRLDAADLLSPKKAMSDFSRLQTDDDSVASGNDSAGWEEEDKRMRLRLDAKAISEDNDNILEDNGPVNEVEEFMLIAGGGEDGEDVIDNLPPAEPEFEMVRATLDRETSVAALKEIAKMFSLPVGAQKKELIFNPIRDSPHMTKISKTEFEYRCPKMGAASAGGKKIPTWILLTPKEVPSVDGVDMGTGAQSGFFGPTNKENAVGGKRSNFLTLSDEQILRPKFGPKREKKRKAGEAKPPPAREDGHPSDYCHSLLPPISRARPKDYFNTQLTPTWFDWCTTATNLRAYLSGAGSGEYRDFMPFDLAEVYKMIGVLFANGLTPKPQFDFWFCTQEEEPLFG